MGERSSRPVSRPALPVTTTFELPGFRVVECRGVVRGIVVRSPTLLQGFLGGLKTMIGGRIGAYSAMCEQTRQQAYDEMVNHARQLGANAIVGMRYDGSSVETGSNGASEVLCYGTAVVVEPL
jgi:uncharacterized protein YbjQ (UPF0145 family)